MQIVDDLRRYGSRESNDRSPPIVLKNSLSACGGTGLLILSSSMNRGLTP
jgi:hypothetical protein